MARARFHRWQRVRVIDPHFLTVSKYLEGRVVKIDTARSEAGYAVLVAWKAKIGMHRRATWCPERAIEAMD